MELFAIKYLQTPEEKNKPTPTNTWQAQRPRKNKAKQQSSNC